MDSRRRGDSRGAPYTGGTRRVPDTENGASSSGTASGDEIQELRRMVIDLRTDLDSLKRKLGMDENNPLNHITEKVRMNGQQIGVVKQQASDNSAAVTSQGQRIVALEAQVNGPIKAMEQSFAQVVNAVNKMPGVNIEY
ncbi:MAG: hypothetical protein IPM23_13170 [Candidatus Melainabacteria bacterium]|nr:hypothetical protein [Candidatus Melainabacteria bacterium]